MINKENPSKEYIDYICGLYGDVYDDRIEDCKTSTVSKMTELPGTQWRPGTVAAHKSILVFQRELEERGIKLSSSKIRKILVTGGCWSTERSRKVAELFDRYTTSTRNGGSGLSADKAVKMIAEELGVSIVTVSVNLPYQEVVYNLEKRSKNAIRCKRYKERHKI